MAPTHLSMGNKAPGAEVRSGTPSPSSPLALRSLRGDGSSGTDPLVAGTLWRTCLCPLPVGQGRLGTGRGRHNGHRLLLGICRGLAATLRQCIRRGGAPRSGPNDDVHRCKRRQSGQAPRGPFTQWTPRATGIQRVTLLIWRWWIWR